jgi:hypothetical protein
VRRLTPQSAPEADRTTIASFGNPVEANLARGLLESNGFECWLLDVNYMSLEGEVLAGIQGGIRLQVRAADAAEARAVLDAPSPEPGADDAHGFVPADEVVRCPKCGSANAKPGRPSFLFALASLLLLGLPLIFRRGAMECGICRHRWRQGTRAGL